MIHSKHVQPVCDEAGNLVSVSLSAALWEVASKRLTPVIATALKRLEPVLEAPEPLEDWKLFREYWDFKYPYDAEVRCNHCGASTEDWEHDAEKNFRLKSAQLGGLAVFSCCKCQATVRKKHFKDHICFECSPLVDK